MALFEELRNTFVSVERRNFSSSPDAESTVGSMEAFNGCVTLEPPATMPWDMRFNETNLVSVIAFSVLFFIASIGNLTVFITLFRNRQRRSRVNLFIMHLSVADLCVTLIMMPLEIGWHVTVSWDAGDAACRFFMFFRAFGFYLSSFILVTISLDRYFAIARPLSLNDADKRGKVMLIFAWLFSVMASVPQSVIFHLEKHPNYDFEQCITLNFFPTARHELAYNLFNIICVYVFPLIVIMVSYSLILIEMFKKTKEGRGQLSSNRNRQPYTRRERDQREDDFRRSGLGKLEKARLRTLKMTIVIAFIVCWTPYYVICAWYWFDNKTAEKIDGKVQEGLFLFAVSNSCVDPIVYGIYSLKFGWEIRRCCCRKRERRRLMKLSTYRQMSPRRTTQRSDLSQKRSAEGSRRGFHGLRKEIGHPGPCSSPAMSPKQALVSLGNDTASQNTNIVNKADICPTIANTNTSETQNTHGVGPDIIPCLNLDNKPASEQIELSNRRISPGLSKKDFINT